MGRSARAPWTPAHTAVLLAVLLAMEWASALAWDRLPLSPALAALCREFPALAGWAVGALDRRGSGALQEMAALAWTGLVRLTDLAVILGAARAWRHPGMRLSPGGLSLRAVLFGMGAALAFGTAALLAETAWRLGGGSLFVDVLLGGAADPVYGVRGVQLAWLGVVVLLAPAVEELFFRGVLLDTAMTRASPGMAIAASAAVFALFHLPSSAHLPMVQFLGGAAFCWLALRTGGLLAPWILHAAANTFILVLQVHYQPAP